MSPFTAWLMGWGSLLVESGELLAGRGHRVTGVISGYPPAAQWARDRGVPCAASMAELREAAEAPDYLFSITNHVVLTAEELAVPRRMAINLHSSPLPKYAGVHQTTWALLHGETEHGITWHEMAPKIDAGQILATARFPIEPTDTTLSLDIRCYEHGLAALGELVDELARGVVRGRPQELSQRSYFSSRRLFPRGGLVSWSQPADELDRWCRAGDFGQFDNRFGLPRVLAGDTAFALRGLRRTGRPASAEPGTVLAVTDTAAVVATGTEDVELTSVSTVDGLRPGVGELLAALGIQTGDRLAEPDQALREHFADWARQWGPGEGFWLDHWDNATPASGAPDRPLWLPRPASTRQATTLLNRGLLDRLGAAVPGCDPAAVLATAWLACLGPEHGTPRWSDDDRRDQVAGLEPLVARDVPIDVTLPASLAFAPAARRVAAHLADLAAHGSHLRDLQARYPMHGVGGLALPVALAATARGDRPAPAPDTAVAIGIDPRRPAFHITATDHLGPADTVVRRFAELGREVTALLTAAADAPTTPLGALRATPAGLIG